MGTWLKPRYRARTNNIAFSSLYFSKISNYMAARPLGNWLGRSQSLMLRPMLTCMLNKWTDSKQQSSLKDLIDDRMWICNLKMLDFTSPTWLNRQWKSLGSTTQHHILLNSFECHLFTVVFLGVLWKLKACLFSQNRVVFYRRGIEHLENRWQKFVNNAGKCILEWFIITIDE